MANTKPRRPSAKPRRDTVASARLQERVDGMQLRINELQVNIAARTDEVIRLREHLAVSTAAERRLLADKAILRRVIHDLRCKLAAATREAA